MSQKINHKLAALVTLLSDGHYHDGNTMGESLQMTRSAVWKNMKKLAQLGISIDSIKGKGYALREPLILLEEAKIRKKLDMDTIDIHLFESIASTNHYLQSLSPLKSRDRIPFCLAEHQTQGKGRLNREWYSPFGKNIYLSCLYPFEKDVSELAGLSLVTSLAIVKTLHGYGIVDELCVKWPNDIVYEANKKLSGTLIEIQAESHGASHAIIGIGLNVNMLADDDAISQTWISMQKILHEYIDRNDLCARLINWLLIYLARFNKKGFAPFIDEWMSLDGLINQTIGLKNVNSKIQGKVVGINEYGHLLLRLPTGLIRAFSSGDTTIIKKRAR